MTSSSGRGKWDLGIDLLCYLCLPLISLHFLIENPYAGVEERFVINTAYDFAYDTPYNEFQHIKNPHVVPRTIIPSLILAAIAKPLIWLGFEDLTIQIILRAIVGLQGVLGYYFLAQAIGREYGNNVKRGFLLLCSVQYKLVYNIGRTYPNILAQNILLYMWAYVVKGDLLAAVKVTCYIAVILRSEVALFLFPLCLGYLLFYKGSVFKLLRTGIIHCFTALFITLIPDSIFWKHWGRIVWPELTAFVFNVIDGNSSYWGKRDFFYYFQRMPNLLGLHEVLAVLLLGLGLFQYRKKMMFSFITSIFYIIIYSFLPHKEERFVTYTIAVLNHIIVLGVGSILQGEYFKKNKAILTILKTSIPLILVFMFLQSERELQHRAGDHIGGAATLQLSNYVAKEKVDILVWEPCSLFGATLWTMPLHNPKLNITMMEDSVSHHIKDDSWVYIFFGDNCRNCTDDPYKRDFRNYDVYLTSIWKLPPEKPSNISTDTWTLMETVSVETVPTYNYFSWIHSHIPRRNVSLPIHIYVKNKSLHKISKK
jgi:hypothetical protein